MEWRKGRLSRNSGRLLLLALPLIAMLGGGVVYRYGYLRVRAELSDIEEAQAQKIQSTPEAGYPHLQKEPAGTGAARLMGSAKGGRNEIHRRDDRGNGRSEHAANGERSYHGEGRSSACGKR